MLPSVPFLKPIAAESPDANSRWTCDSVVAGADGPPADQVADVLRRNRIEKLRPRRHAQLIEPKEQIAGHAQPLIDAEAAVQVRIVDEPLPADRRSRLLEVGPHDNFEIARQLPAHVGEQSAILERRGWVMNGTRADDDQQPIGLPAQNARSQPDACGRPKPRRECRG